MPAPRPGRALGAEAITSARLLRARPIRSAITAAGLVLAVFALAAAPARAVILPAVTLDGPSENVDGFGGVAMAEDGTGGAVYLERVGGVAHVFVARYIAGHWLAPVRVDTEEPFAASWPRIGAANGGELAVVWATPFATENVRPVQELLGATLGPGSSTFGRAIIVDPDIREGIGTSPEVAMSSTGQADVVYRVVLDQGSVPLLRPGDVVEQVRVAHFDGQRWSRLGAINRDEGVSMRPPTQANAPQVAIGRTGNAVVVWQEPEIDGVARIWARRLFGATLNYVMPVSATTFAGGPIGSDSDAPSVAISALGQAEVAYRQGAPAGSPLPGPRIFLNILPDGESVNGAQFAGASIADSAVPGGRSATIGRPSIDIDEQRDVRLLYEVNGHPRVIEGTGLGLTAALSLGPGFVGSELSPADEVPSASVINPSGGGISAWPSADVGGHPAVAVREDFPRGAVQTGILSGGAGGPIGELAVARSGLGDGLVVFQQGPLGNASIVASQVTAPPATFVATVPRGWIRPAQARIAWEEAPSANGPLSYAVVLDGHPLASLGNSLSYTINPRWLGDGRHVVQVLATDIFGQSSLTATSPLLIDTRPPTITVARARPAGSVTVRVLDSGSGVEVRSVIVSFGDGHSARGRSLFHHSYPHPSVYLILAHVRDRVGNQGVVRRLVSVG